MNDRKNIISIIKRVWATELPFSDFSVTDDFFELGGNSLKLIAVLDKLQKIPELKFIDELTVIELFDTPILDNLATLIESKLLKPS
ncbi:MAG: hypothetical protein K0R49_26 [Burkholderiales bacterium]|nr:hypothetical protein [Burkholderiales bacterium]